MYKNIKSVVLTGGPCAGKSTALCRIIEFIGGLGHPVVSVPEAASELMSNGIVPEGFRDPHIFQDHVIKKIILNEIFFANALNALSKNSIKKGILICDRGLLDALAYVNKDLYQRLLVDNDIGLDSLYGSRYDAVVHLKSAACGAEDFYTIANNAARKESPEEARELDKKTMNAWVGHPNLAIVDNDHADFEGKINAVVRVIAQLLGVPKPLTIERKWLVESQDLVAQTAEIVQYYFNDGRDRLRSWTREGVTTYFHAKKSNTPSRERVKTERIITQEQYEELMGNDCNDMPFVQKMRKYFVWENQYFRLDYFPGAKRQILEVQPTNAQREIKLPKNLRIIGEVTDNEEYYNYTIAQRFVRKANLACLN